MLPDYKKINHYQVHSSSAMKFGRSPWHKYSSQSDADPQSFRSRKISSVKVEPIDPINTPDRAQMVLSSIASTFMKIKNRLRRMRKKKKIQKRMYNGLSPYVNIYNKSCRRMFYEKRLVLIHLS